MEQPDCIRELENELVRLKEGYDKDCKKIKTQTVEEVLAECLEQYERNRKCIVKEIEERNRWGSFYGWAD